MFFLTAVSVYKTIFVYRSIVSNICKNSVTLETSRVLSVFYPNKKYGKSNSFFGSDFINPIFVSPSLHITKVCLSFAYTINLCFERIQFTVDTLYTLKLINKQTKTYLFLLIANYSLHEIFIAFSSFENFPSFYIETYISPLRLVSGYVYAE